MDPHSKRFDVPVVEVPKDDEKYTKSFTPDQLEEIREFFSEFGFVVVRDVIPENIVDGVQDEILQRAKMTQFAEKLRRSEPLEMDEIESVNWENVYLSGYNRSKGFLGYDVASSQAAQELRQHPNVHSVFASLYGTVKLWNKFDRFGIMRPTKGIKSVDDLEDRDEWKTDQGFVHWDANPWDEPEPMRVQGVFTLTDHTATSGGFHCIPGFHKVYNQYAEAYKHLQAQGCLVNLMHHEDKQLTQHITMRRGSFVIWDSRLPHGNWPNEDNTFRMCHYLTYFPIPTNKKAADSRKLDMDCFRSYSTFPESVSDLGKAIIGLEDYPEDMIKKFPYEGKPVFQFKEDSMYNYSQWGIDVR